jgi:hypothetical protein
MKHMWISITEILPTRGKEYKVRTRWNDKEVIAYYTGYDFICTEDKKIVLISHWYKEA